METVELLRRLSFGHRIAEDESRNLSNYFVKTQQWRNIYEGNVDIIFGPKGSGKSAIYACLVNKQNELFDRNIILTRAEKLRGQPAFKVVISNPPSNELEFERVWKLYFLQLIAETFISYDIKNNSARKVIHALKSEGLIMPQSSLSVKISAALKFVRKLAKLESVEVGVPGVIKGKLIRNESDSEDKNFGDPTIDHLFEDANNALEDEDLTIWIALDRLDVAFDHDDTLALEEMALRSLFRTYNSLRDHERIRLKIFLRDDIWKTVTKKRFREATHIAAHTTISWDSHSLLNLVSRRLLKNEELVTHYHVQAEEILADLTKQKELFHRVFPDQIASGNRFETFEWMLRHVTDGTHRTTPREIIHLLNVAKENQIHDLEIGINNLSKEGLFSRRAILKSLREVSNERLYRTLLSEHPHLKKYVDGLERQKSTQSIGSLQDLWHTKDQITKKLAQQFVDIGLFEESRCRRNRVFEVPLLYRPALRMCNGQDSGHPQSHCNALSE